MNKGLLETMKDREFIVAPSSFTLETLETIIKDLSKKESNKPRKFQYPELF